MVAWFWSYLEHREQRVNLDGALSTYQSVHYGVPQGSVFGPILLSIYINSIGRQVKHSKIKMYVDDTNLYGENPQHDLGLVATWCDDNMLTLNSNYKLLSPSRTYPPFAKKVIWHIVESVSLGYFRMTYFRAFAFKDHLKTWYSLILSWSSRRQDFWAWSLTLLTCPSFRM